MNVKLVVVQGRPAGKSLVFPPGDYYFGRGAECHVRPNSEWVSRQHCLLRVTLDAVFVRDLGSRNGTLVNGQRVVQERPLGHGDQLQVGPLVFEIRLDEVHVSKQPSTPDLSSAMTPTVPNIDCRHDLATSPSTASASILEEAVQEPESQVGSR